MQAVALAAVRCLARLADDEHQLGFVVERLGGFRPDDRLSVRHHGGAGRA